MQNIIFLYDPSKRDQEAKKKLEQIVNLYDYSMKDIQTNIDRIVQYLAKHIGDGPGNIYIISQHIRMRLTKNGPVIDLPIVEFLCNMIMLAPLIDMNIEMESRHLFNPVKLTDSEIRRYINNMIYEYRDRVTFFRMCEYIQFVKKNFNKICIHIGERIGSSISINQFISVMDDDKEMEEILTCTFNIPKDLTPSELEDLVNKKTTKLMNHIMTRQDLDLSTYVKNNLFNKGQFKEFAVHITHKPNLSGNTVPLTSNTNILMGTNDISAYYTDSAGGRKAEVLKLNVSKQYCSL